MDVQFFKVDKLSNMRAVKQAHDWHSTPPMRSPIADPTIPPPTRPRARLTRKRVLVKAERIGQYLLRRPVLMVIIALAIVFVAAVAVPETRTALHSIWVDDIWWRIYGPLRVLYTYIIFYNRRL